MASERMTTGISNNGLPYVRIEGGHRVLVIFEGLNFVHRPPRGMALRGTVGPFKVLAERSTIYYVGRRPKLPEGYSMRDMAEDYAIMIREQIGHPVDVLGLSTGGPIAMEFAVGHRELVRRLVLASTGYRLSDSGKRIQREVIDQVRRGRWRKASSAFAAGIFVGPFRPLLVGFFWLLGKGMFGSPDDPSDGLVELEAEDRFDFSKDIGRIGVPTLVIGGALDNLYPIKETAEMVPGAKAVIYERSGHMAVMKDELKREILNFLEED